MKKSLMTMGIVVVVLIILSLPELAEFTISAACLGLAFFLFSKRAFLPGLVLAIIGLLSFVTLSGQDSINLMNNASS